MADTDPETEQYNDGNQAGDSASEPDDQDDLDEPQVSNVPRPLRDHLRRGTAE